MIFFAVHMKIEFTNIKKTNKKVQAFKGTVLKQCFALKGCADAECISLFEYIISKRITIFSVEKDSVTVVP